MKHIVKSQKAAGKFFCGVTPRTVQSWVAAGCPGKRGSYDLAIMLRWLVTEGPWKLKKSKAAGDPPVVGSRALEQYREECMKTARIKRLRLEGALVEWQIIDESLTTYSTILRGKAEALRRECGERALEIFEEALNDCEEFTKRMFETIKVETIEDE